MDNLSAFKREPMYNTAWIAMIQRLDCPETQDTTKYNWKNAPKKQTKNNN